MRTETSYFGMVVLLLGLSLACSQGEGASQTTQPPATDNPSTAANSNTTTSSPNQAASANPNQSDLPSTPNTTVEDPNHPSSGPTLRVVGRMDANNLFGWPATTFLTRVIGTGVEVNLTPKGATTYQNATVSAWFDVWIDGTLSNTFSLSPNVTRYVVADNLAAGDHIVRLVKRTESQMGTAVFGGFVATGNSVLAPAPEEASRRLEFIGDSITAGYGCEGNVATYSGCPNFTIGTENADSTFASMTAAALGAEFTAISFSGKGIYQNDDCFGDPYYTLPMLYDDTVPQQGESWDFNSWVPQAVVINLGTNDYNEDNGCAIPSDANFTAAWVSFLSTVRSVYPAAYILCTVGPEVPAANLARAEANIQAAVSTLRGHGDTNVGYVALEPDTGANGVGCAGHPNQATHRIMAATVTQALQDALGW